MAGPRMPMLGFAEPPEYGPVPSDAACEHVYDVCIIGSGAAGSIAAHELVGAGFDVVMLDQGPFVTERVTFADIVKEAEPAYIRLYGSHWALQGNPWTTCNVGGGTVWYGGASFRYREVDFRASRYFPEADLPIDWPYDYAALEPFYDEVEDLIGVAADPSGDPTAPPTKNARYLPPIEPSRNGAVILEAARSLGLRAFPTPLAIATVPHRGREACEKDSACINQRCARGAKGDVATTLLRPLMLRGGRFTLFAGLRAARLERDTRAVVDRVIALRVDTGTPFTFRARHFIVACSAVESSALLLRSADRFTPNGIGNEHDMVGRGLCFKASQWVAGWRGDPSDAAPWENRGPFSTVSITDYYLDPAAPGGVGGLIYETGLGSPHTFGGGDRPLRIECILADLPQRENRVLLARDTNALGLPRLVMDYTPHPRDEARLEHMIGRCEEILRAARSSVIVRSGKDYRLGSSHLHGTCRGGTDVATSVVDPWSRVHTVDNLYVMDGAFMPYPGGVNPTLTIQAHALRAARHLARTVA